MAPKKETAAKFLVRARGEGVWARGTGEAAQQGEFRVSVDTDLAQVVIHIGPDYLEDWNPAPLRSYSMRYLRGGSYLRIAFELEKPLGCRGELELSVFGGLAGKFEDQGGPAKVTGAGIVEEARDHVFDIPRPSKALAEKLQREPSAVRWEAPDCVREGSVTLVGIGGPSKSGKSLLAKALAESLRAQGREAAVVDQSRHERSVGQYHCSANAEESMYENPSAVNWNELVKDISSASARVAQNCAAGPPGFVIVEGSLVFWMPQISQALAKRIFLRTSRNEVLRRRQASQTLAEPFVEHVFWPMHLQYGQPQAPWEDIRVEDESDGFPLSEELLSEALGILGLGTAAPVAAAPEKETQTLAEADAQGAQSDAASAPQAETPSCNAAGYAAASG